MGLVIGTFFYVHTVMCTIYLFYLVKKSAEVVMPGKLATEGSPGEFADEFSGQEERVVQVTAYVVLGLYLLFTEAYLYRLYKMFTLT